MMVAREDVLPKTKASLYWSGGAYGITALLNFAMLFVLVKVLAPADMALIFIAIIFQDLSMLFVDNGMGSYVIQAEVLSHRERSSLFWQGVLTGVLFCLLLFLLAPALAGFFHSPALRQGLRITALGLLPITLAFPQKALLQRNMHFRRIALAEFAGMAAACGVTIGMALNGWGFVSYLYGFLARKTVELLILWLKEPWWPTVCLTVEQMRRLFSFSLYASGGVLSAYAVRLVDTFMVGRILGVHALGLYSLANNLVFFPVSKCVATFSRVFISTFSHLKGEPAELAAAFNRSLHSLTTLLVPALLFLAVLIPDILKAFFAPEWLPVADLVRILILNGFLILFLRLGESLLLARNQARLVFLMNGLTILLTSLLLLWLTPAGLDAAAWAVVLGAVLPVFWMQRVLSKTIGFSVADSLKQSGNVLLAAIGAGLLLWIGRPLIATAWGPKGVLLVLCPVALVFYIGIWRLAKAGSPQRSSSATSKKREEAT